MLSPYRVLDLTDEKGLLCGKILGDLGADVIKIERPGGDPARRLGPFYHDEVNLDKSLFWFAYNTSKRGVTLDIETAEGQEAFRKLVKTADVVIESFPPGYLGGLGLGYPALEKVNPGIILVSITPFGQTGPYKDYKAPDIVGWAMSGFMYSTGDPDRPPVQVSHHSQAYLFAGAEAAGGAMMALYYRQATGEGQQVDVSIHEAVFRSQAGGVNTWYLNRTFQRRGEMPGQLSLPHMWPCKDGYVMFTYHGGQVWKTYNLPLFRLMDDEGVVDDFLKGFDWEAFSTKTATPEIVARIIEPTGKFFMAHTTAELYRGALKYGAPLFPVATAAEIMESVQLAARGYWVELEHPELGTTITYPGAFTCASEAPPRLQCRAPLIGEHNDEVLNKELDLSKEQLMELRQVKNYSATAVKKSARRKLSRPLEGIKVVDFGQLVAGSLIGKELADCGAEVIRIEGRTRMEGYRSMGPFKDNILDADRSTIFFQFNSSKLSVALNLARPRGVEIAKKLVARADVVVENFAGGAMNRMGLGYEELKKVKPDIIMLSACIMGQTGPHFSHSADGSQLTGLSGFSHLAGWPDRPPAYLGIYTDFVVPSLAVTAVLAALDYRRRTGKGQYIDMSQYEAGVQFMSPILLDYVANQRIATRMGNSSPYAAPYGAYRCHGDDRWCAIAVYTDEEWQSFSRVIGNPSWARDLRFSTLQARRENGEELDRLVDEWTINHEAEEVMSLMQAAGVAAGVVQNIEDLMERDPQLRHRHYFWELDHPVVGRYHAPGQPFVLSKSPCEVRRVPLLGEHNEYVLRKILGLSDDEISELLIEGVVE